MSLDAYEQVVVSALRSEADLEGADVVRWAVRCWAATSLAQVCPLTSAVLAGRDRWEEEVDLQLAQGDRPAVLREWGRDFAVRLTDDADPLVAAAAGLEAAALSRAAAPGG
ncbi:hypothetical protein D0Z08_20155 [Nocardioides immobilis]|uniref:Uncharacterized protein n=1 Tax=Nocardioides immobilis TaxID=2049295 RepID=A0A417XY01_9ACTN|nr:hypothetical protein [Nocardioides immobilis]RHW25276.1 hypothetical protein D0Z08_20155 [Nocardioides immobilis]